MATSPKGLREEIKVKKETGAISSSAAAIPSTLVTLPDIIKKALITDNRLVQKALKQEQAFRFRTEKELAEILSKIQKFFTEKTEKEIEAIQKATLEKLETDLELINSLNAALKAYQPKDLEPKYYTESDLFICTYPAKFNKMALAIPGAKSLVSEHFKPIVCENHFPSGYAFSSKPEDVTVLKSNPLSIYGDSKATFLKTALLNIELTCFGKTRLQESLTLDETALAHITPLPINLDLDKLDIRFSKFTYLFSEPLTLEYPIKQGLAFIHSGYAFGGHRDIASRYALGTKLYGPEDCSSWVAKLLGSKEQFSTLDQLYTYRLSCFKSYQMSLGTVPSDYASGPIYSEMTGLFDPIIIRDPQKDIRAGQIYVHRGYDLKQDPTMSGPGTGGHTGLVLDFISAGKDSSVVIMGYGRNMPEEEGFGVQTFPWTTENRKALIFSLKIKEESAVEKKSTDPSPMIIKP